MGKQRTQRVGLLVNTDVPTVALGLYHISSALKAAGIPCFIHKFQDIKRLFSGIQGLDVSVMGFSVHWHSQLIPSLKIAEQVIAEFPGVTIVLGGITASCFGEELIRFAHVDFVVVGDGEIPFLNILQGKEPSVIPNVYWKTPGHEIRFNGVSYHTSAERMRDFIYENSDDFQATRSILKMGKGCFFKCFHCGGRNEALKGHGCDLPVFFEAADIRRVVERNYRKLKFKHLYLAQDHFRDIRNIAQGLAQLPDDITKSFTVNVAAWGLPDMEYVKILGNKFPAVCLELTFDVLHETLLKDSRGLRFGEKTVEEGITSYLRELFAVRNLELLIFFSYPHIHNGAMIFPDFRTLKALFDWEDLFRQEHLEGRLGICYLLLSTDPASAYGEKYPFEVFWERLLQRKSGFGSLCFHFREYMDEDLFDAHHLFVQTLMKLLEISTNFTQYIYRILFRSDMEKCYASLFRIFEGLYRNEIIPEMKVMQSYAESQSYLGYSCTKQEYVDERQLSNLVFRFLGRCFDEGLIGRDFEAFRYVYHCEARVNGASYISCLDLSQNNAGKEKNCKATFPIKNPYVNLFCKVKNLHFILSEQLLEAGSVYPKREEEALFALFAGFSLKELIAVFDEERCSRLYPDMWARVKSVFPEFSAATKEARVRTLYLMTKSFNTTNAHAIKPMLKLLVAAHERHELEELMITMQEKRLHGLEWKLSPVNYAVTEKTRRLIPLSDEELFILNRCNGLNSLFDLSEAFTAAFSLDIAMFGTIIEFFYMNRLLC